MYIRKERVFEVQRHTSVLAVTSARRWLARVQVVARVQGQLSVLVLPWAGHVPSAAGMELPACPPLGQGEQTGNRECSVREMELRRVDLGVRRLSPSQLQKPLFWDSFHAFSENVELREYGCSSGGSLTFGSRRNVPGSAGADHAALCLGAAV